MFLEYLDPKEHIEYTVDLYYDRHSELKCVVPRQRIEVRGGEVSKGVTRKNFLVKYLPEKMNRLEGARGCLTLQVFVNTQSSKVTGIEINPRFGGGYPLSYLAGANFSKWIIDEYFFNKKIDYFDGWEDNLLMLRYDDEVLVHGASIK
jgi:carbamoyl-phosphate synthase large subunit